MTTPPSRIKMNLDVSQLSESASVPSNSTAPPASEIAALNFFYEKLNGPNWIRKIGWKNDQNMNPCGDEPSIFERKNCYLGQWSGVLCIWPLTSDSPHVCGLQLKNNGLQSIDEGAFAEAIAALANLTEFRYLDLSNMGFLTPRNLTIMESEDNIRRNNRSRWIDNNLNITALNRFPVKLPNEICAVGGTLLKTLLLGHTELRGQIPSCLDGTTMPGLSRLYLDFNYFTGETPRSLCGLRRLKKLLLAGNQLSGPLLDCLSNCSKLKVIDYTSNRGGYFDEPEKGIQTLSGKIPRSLCELSQLESLKLQYTQHLTGPIPDCLGAAQSALKLVLLQANMLTGAIPTSLCNPGEALKQINVYENFLSGTIPGCLGENLQKLTKFGVGSNHLTGYPFDDGSLRNLSKLRYLWLDNNYFGGSIPSYVGSSWPEAEWISLDANRLTGSLPDSVCDLKDLQALKVSRNQLTGSLPECLSTSFANLYQLDLSRNKFAGSLPGESFCETSYGVQLLRLHSNHLTGTIPQCYGTSLLRLRSMLLHDNKLTGPLPHTWNLSRLEVVILSNNPSLAGTLPSSLFTQNPHFRPSNSIASRNLLRAVVIEGSNIKGPLPREAVCDAIKLETLALSGNRLTSQLPNCLSSLNKLETLRLSSNSFTGYLPSAIGTLSSLKTLDVSDNQISGTVPKELGSLSPQLVVAKISLNRLSCSLPKRIKKWRSDASPATTPMVDDDFSSQYYRDDDTYTSTVRQPFELSLLFGNLFKCPIGDFSHAFGNPGATRISSLHLYRFDDESHSYSCGSSFYVLPVIGIILIIVPILTLLLRACNRKRLMLNIRQYPKLVRTAILDSAALALASLGVAFVALVVVLPVVLTAKSPYECQYAGRPTLGYKAKSKIYREKAWEGSNDDYDSHDDKEDTANDLSGEISLSHGMGAAVGAALVFGLLPWWRRAITATKRKHQDGTSLHGKTGTRRRRRDSKKASLRLECERSSVGNGDGGGGVRNEQRNTCEFKSDEPELPPVSMMSTSAISLESLGNVKDLPRKYMSQSERFLRIILQTVVVVVAALAPNILYVYIMVRSEDESNSELGNFKQFAIYGIVATKVLLAITVIPAVSRYTTNLILPDHYNQLQRSTISAASLRNETIDHLSDASRGVMSEEGDRSSSKHDSLHADRFRLRTNVAAALASFGLIIAPIIVVLMTDRRCSYYYFWPEEDQHKSVVTVDYCASYYTLPFDEIQKHSDVCIKRERDNVVSRFTPRFQYSGDQCISAVIEIYAPVYLVSVLLAAAIPALLELLLVPALAPVWFLWQQRSQRARLGIRFLRLCTKNVRLEIALHLRQRLSNRSVTSEIGDETLAISLLGKRSADEDESDAEAEAAAASLTWITPSILNAIAQSAVERGFVQLISTLLLTLTLGLAAPAVGCAAAVAAIVQFIHHLHIVGQVDAVGKLFSERQGLRLSRVANFQSMENSIFRSNSVQTEPYVIKLRQCHRIPWGCGVIVTVTTLCVWTGINWRFLDSVKFIDATAVVGVSTVLAFFFINYFFVAKNERKLPCIPVFLKSFCTCFRRKVHRTPAPRAHERDGCDEPRKLPEDNENNDFLSGGYFGRMSDQEENNVANLEARDRQVLAQYQKLPVILEETQTEVGSEISARTSSSENLEFDRQDI